jgi:hypothetical protein
MLNTYRKDKNNLFYAARKKNILEIQRRRSMQIVPVKFIPESFSRAGPASWDFNLALQREEGGRGKGFKHEKGFPPLLSYIMRGFLKFLFHVSNFVDAESER